MKNIGRRVLSFLCAAVMLLSMVVLPEGSLRAEATDGLNLAKMQIVLPKIPTSVENTAANELKNYIYKMTGTTPAVVIEGSNTGAGIYIGATNYASAMGVTYPTAGDEKGEAWAIKAVDGNLVLCGAPKRGALYAVYHLLEDVLGVRWWNMWEEYVPEGNAIVPADYTSSGVPAMEYREVFVGNETNTDYPFYARNRVNGDTSHIPASYGGQEDYGFYHIHTFGHYFTATDFAAHPEWFSQIDGARVSDGQLCLTNSSLKTEFAARLVAQVANAPKQIYSVSPNDNERFCQCSSCKSAINTYGTSGYVLSFVNEMANAVTNAGYTDAKVEMLVYWSYVDVPKGGVTPASNVQLRIADNYTDLLHGLDHANNAASMNRLQAWMNLAANKVFYWQYVVNYNNNGIFPSMFHYGEDFSTLVEMGVDGWFAEQENCINADFWDMKLWLITKLMEKPVTGDEYAALMDEFIYGYYGAAGQHIRDYLYYMNAKAETASVSQTYGVHIIGAEWLGVQDILAGNEYFEKAFAAAGGDAVLLRRLRSARSGLDRVIVENFGQWQTQAASAGLTLPFTRREVGERIYQTVQEQSSFRGEYDLAQKNYLSSRYDGFSDTQAALPNGLTADVGHYLEYNADDFRIAAPFVMVEDTDSSTGRAVSATANSDMRLQSGFSYLECYYYNSSTAQSSRIGRIRANSIKVNQGYQLYSFQWTVPSSINVDDYFYMFGNWSFQNVLMMNELRAFAGQTVTIYLNMKVTGTAYGSSSTPVYHIDRMFVVPYSQTTHSYAVSPSAYDSGCRSVCSICGDVKLTEHTWNEGIVTQAPSATQNGVTTYTCTVCGTTKMETVYAHSQCKFGGYVYEMDETGNTLGSYTGTCAYGCGKTDVVAATDAHVKSFKAADIFTFAYNGTFEDQVVTDSDSVVGSAVQYAAYPRRNENTNWLIMGPGKSVMMYTTGSTEKIFEMTGEELKVNQGYQLYKFSYENFSISDNPGVIYMFGDWGLQSAALANTLKTYKGKSFDMYLSMKITGDIYGENLSADSSENWPVYRIDRVMLAELCSFGDYTSDNNGTCALNGTKSHSCSVCGLTEYIMEPDSANPENHNWDEGIVTREPTVDAEGEKTYTCLACGTAKTETLEKLPQQNNTLADELDEMDKAGHIYANYVPSTFDGAETFVTDPDAYSAQSAIQAGPFNLSVNGFGFYAYSGSNGDLKLDEIAPEELLVNQGYQIYKLSANITDSLADSACTYYRSDAGAWKFVNFNGGTVVKAFVGKQLDIYISLKIEGSLENATCYVDRLAFVDPCENYAGEDGKCTKCGKELPLPASHELFDYNANNFTGTSETDAEAYKGIAKSYSGKDLTAGAAVKIHRYDTGASDVSIQYMKVGELAAANIKNNQGYQTYEFTTTIPAEGMTDSSPFVYFLDDWSFQNAQMAKDLKTLAGKTVTISLSMKVVGELSDATVYIDRVQILSVCEDYLNEDGTQCRVCGKSMLDESLPEELQRLDENHLFRYNTSNFAVNADSGESIVADAGSLLGSAFYCANLNIGSKIELYRYDNAAAADQQYVFIGAIAAADVKLNQGYQFYKFTVDLPAEGMANGNFVYVDYAGWKCLNATMAHDMKTLAGKTVDVYLSLKVVGSDTSNTECYIDQMIMVDSCSYEAVVTAPTCTEAGYTTYTCPICGDSYVADQTAAKGHTEVVDAAAAPTCTETGLTEGKHCSACGEVLVAQEVVPALDHSYGDWNVTEPTYTAAGSQSKTCSRCGDVVTEEIPVLANPVSTWNIALGDNIGVNFVMALTDTDVVDVTVNGNAVACTIADGKISIYVAAAQMMDEIAISVNGMPLANTYSVRRYADAILADASQSDCHELVKNMLNYGAASQSYFGYNSDHLANDGIAVEAATVPAEGGEVTVSGEAQGIRFYGASLVHENKIAVRFYFAGSIEGIDFGAYTVNQKNGMYYIEVADIVPQNLENDIVVSVSDGANTLTVAYAPVDYIIRMYNKIDAAENTRALVQALYGYYLAAEAYTAA